MRYSSKYLLVMMAIVVFGCVDRQNAKLKQVIIESRGSSKTSVYLENEIFEQAIFFIQEALNTTPKYITTRCQYKVSVIAEHFEMHLELCISESTCFLRQRKGDRIMDYLLSEKGSEFFRKRCQKE